MQKSTCHNVLFLLPTLTLLIPFLYPTFNKQIETTNKAEEKIHPSVLNVYSE